MIYHFVQICFHIIFNYQTADQQLEDGEHQTEVETKYSITFLLKAPHTRDHEQTWMSFFVLEGQIRGGTDMSAFYWGEICLNQCTQ